MAEALRNNGNRAKLGLQHIADLSDLVQVTHRNPEGEDNIPEEIVHAELERILSSSTFCSADLLKELLAFLVRWFLSGKKRGPKEYTIGVEVFHRRAAFDPRFDPIVRVQVHRLRLKRYSKHPRMYSGRSTPVDKLQCG